MLRFGIWNLWFTPSVVYFYNKLNIQNPRARRVKFHPIKLSTFYCYWEVKLFLALWVTSCIQNIINLFHITLYVLYYIFKITLKHTRCQLKQFIFLRGQPNLIIYILTPSTVNKIPCQKKHNKITYLFSCTFGDVHGPVSHMTHRSHGD